ncbi:hypothetical protein EV643_1683 [Kribbella sp. VKM Ac-2527]|uniref:Uncharacterized protein n=2 Tax=Kribbella caucasensis TaxID=2512215 RepID=A0A4R6IU94_9ACTN|nr:hypothetical protein EV643_1683 [Kribbella sp. VKM Ac-2527]
MLRYGEIPDLPQPDDALMWFLLNIVGLPSLVVGVAALVLWALSWIAAARTAVRRGTRVVRGAGAILQTRRGPLLVGTIVVQTALVATTYIMGQIAFAMAPKRSGPPADIDYVLSVTLAYDHWTRGSLLVVQGAVALVVLIDLFALVRDPEETPLNLLMGLAGGLALLLAFTGSSNLTGQRFWSGCAPA